MADVRSNIPAHEPTSLIAGETWEWDRSISEYPPSSGWTLKYLLRGPEDAAITAAANAQNSGYEVRVTPANSDLDAGVYRLVGWVEKAGGDPKIYVYQGTLVVQANPVTAVNAKTHAEKTLALIEAAIEGRVPKDVESFEINGRRIDRIKMPELLRLRGAYRAMVWREKNPNRSHPSHAVTFVADS